MSDRGWARIEIGLEVLCWMVTYSLAFIIMIFCLIGCSADRDRPRFLDLAVKGSYSPGEAIGTRNQTPQGGTDEKSGSTPTKPVD